MKNVRIFFKKTGRLKFISHLDLTRVMSRIITKSKLPVWYTEGFNQHLYMNFALPLSLGFDGVYEVLEIRLTDDCFRLEDCLEALKSVSIEGLEFVSVNDPVMPMKDIAFAEFLLDFSDTPDGFEQRLNAFLGSDSIICLKKGKKGKFKEIDIIPKINRFSFSHNQLTLRLTAGNEDNLNPTLVMDKFFEENADLKAFYSVTRTAVFNKDHELFR